MTPRRDETADVTWIIKAEFPNDMQMGSVQVGDRPVRSEKVRGRSGGAPSCAAVVKRMRQANVEKGEQRRVWRAIRVVWLRTSIVACDALHQQSARAAAGSSSLGFAGVRHLRQEPGNRMLVRGCAPRHYRLAPSSDDARLSDVLAQKTRARPGARSGCPSR
jgi:hypothetical protein